MSRDREVKPERRLQTVLYGSGTLLQFDLFDSAIPSYQLRVNQEGSALEHVAPSEFVESQFRYVPAGHRALPVQGEAILHRDYMDCRLVSLRREGDSVIFISLLLDVIILIDKMR